MLFRWPVPNLSLVAGDYAFGEPQWRESDLRNYLDHETRIVMSEAKERFLFSRYSLSSANQI